MRGFLLDTVVVSEPMRKAPDRQVIAWLSAADERTLHLSVITLGEIRKGIDLLPDRPRRDHLERWLGDLRERFGERVLPIDEAVANRWGQLCATTAAQPLPSIDAQIAATALYHGLTLVTRNVADVGRSGVPVLNPWTQDR